MGGVQHRAKRVAKEAWKREQVAAWSITQDLEANAVALSHPKNEYEVLMFSDASENLWGSFLTQFPLPELEGGVEIVKYAKNHLDF